MALEKVTNASRRVCNAEPADEQGTGAKWIMHGKTGEAVSSYSLGWKSVNPRISRMIANDDCDPNCQCNTGQYCFCVSHTCSCYGRDDPPPWSS